MNQNKSKTIALCSTARFVELSVLESAQLWLIKQGFKVVLASNLVYKHHQFGGTDEQRSQGFQSLIDNPEIDAIWCLRGGYGTVRMMENLNWTSFRKNPKQLIGFSDFTILLNHVLQFNITSIHSPMPIQFKTLDENCKQRLVDILNKELKPVEWESSSISSTKTVSGKLIGGNLSMLYSFIGSESFPNTENGILFIEDLDEYSYHLDRMMFGLWRSGSLDNLKAILVGDFIAIHDHDTPFGETAEEIFTKFANKLNIPIYFNFPAGHSDVNHPIVLGKNITLSKNTRSEFKMEYHE